MVAAKRALGALGRRESSVFNQSFILGCHAGGRRHGNGLRCGWPDSCPSELPLPSQVLRPSLGPPSPSLRFSCVSEPSCGAQPACHQRGDVVLTGAVAAPFPSPRGRG